jgi:molybdate transport system regulatory protein
LNRTFDAPVLTTATGGREGGGTSLTPLGIEVVERYRRAEALAMAAASKEIGALRKLMRR